MGVSTRGGVCGLADHKTTGLNRAGSADKRRAVKKSDPGATTEAAQHRFRDADAWPAEEALAAMLDSQVAALCSIRAAVPALAAAVAEAARRLSGPAGRLVYAGAGASARLAVQDGVELYPTFGWPHDRLAYLIAGGPAALLRSVEGAEDDAAAGQREAEALQPGPDDVFICVAASGTTRYTCAVQSAARAAGAATIGLANNPGAPLLEAAEFPVLLQSGAEFLAGSTRMGAGTAQKAALNLFSTRLMAELGRVYAGRMVCVVPSNAKLIERAKRMVAQLTGASDADAAAAWTQTGDIRLAVLMLDGVGEDEARRRLAAACGNLRRARHG